MTRRRNFGTIRQRPNGKWQARYLLDGKQVSAGMFPTPRAASKALAEVENELGKGTHVDPREAKTKLSAYWAGYSATKTNWKPRTRSEREGLWRRHIEPVLGGKALGEITTTMVKNWHAGLYAEHPATAQGAYRLLRQVLNAAVDDNRLVRNPCRVKGAGVDSAPERLVATVAEVETIVSNMPERMRLMVLLAMWAGLRESELLGLRRADLDPVHRTVRVAQTAHQLNDGAIVFQEPKTAAGRRTVAYPASIDPEVKKHLKLVGLERDALIFTGDKGGPLRRHVFGAAFRKARLVAGRPKLTLHDLRHTADTLAASQGASLPELMYRMGHSTPHAAIRYLHATKERDRVLADLLAELRPLAGVVSLDERRDRGASGS